ncbi:VWD domain-containing protein, partial [Aquicoccus sp.]|uniref:VWD domain-containing protein n=2 Tax=Aquicoccus sp. TaxID=2055851 RepID=UPI00356B0AC9
LESASSDWFGSAVNMPDGSTLEFVGLTEAQVASIDPVSAAAAVDGILIEGTPGDDNIDPSAEGSTGGWDTIVGSTGDDVLDLSSVSNTNGVVTLEYGELAGPITADLDGAANTASVGKGSDGTDTIIDIANPLDAGWTLGGLIMNGTTAADTFNLDVADEQWMEIRPGDGVDEINLSGQGLVRIDFRGADNGIDVDLRSNSINDDGYGNTETISGNTPWGIRGSEHDDVFRGSDDVFTSFRKVGGNDTLDGGAAFGRVRYETSGISDLRVDLAAGTATGTIDGVEFSDTISNFQHVRGSSGDDWLAGDSLGGVNRLEGRGGADTFVPGVGQTQIGDFTPGVSTLDISRLGLTIAEVENALQNGFDNGSAIAVNLPDGSSLAFFGLSEEDVASITPVIEGSGGILQEGTSGDDVFNGTDGDDTAIGNGGDDQFNLGAGDDEAFVGEGSAFIRAGSGDDTYHFTDVVEGYVQVEYGHLTDPEILGSGLTVDIDGAANTGTIVKGDLGTDTLVDVENPLDAGATVGGLGIGGTLGDDTFNLSTTEDQWMQVRPVGGDDTINIDSGFVRIDYADGLPAAIDADLVAGIITRSDGSNSSTDTITGDQGAWEIRGTDLADTILGSDRDESFILRGGDDTLDAGDGFDRLRYDRPLFNGGVDADLDDGTVTGTAIVGGANEEFTHTISNIEHLRGTAFNDRIAGDDNDNRLEGMDGDDAFVLVGGSDSVYGGDGTDQAFFGVTEDEATVTSDGDDNHTVVIGSDTIELFSVEDLIFQEPGEPENTPPAPSGAAPAWTLGDPHLLTVDGVGYDFHAVGEYVLLRGQAGESVNGFEIQSRMTPAKDDEGADLDDVSVNQAIAMRAANGDAVMIDSNDAEPLSVNGTVQTIEDGEFLDVGDDRIYRTGETYTMVFAGDDGTINDGDTQVAVKVLDGRVDLSVRISDELAGRVEGLLGDGDGDRSNDVALADGTVLERPFAFDDLYGDYRDDWRVDDEADSLFTYDTGESLAGFYDPDKPGSVTTADDFDPAEQDAARQAAEDAGLTPGSVNFDNAVLDFLLTGDSSFVESSASEDVAAPETTSSAPTLDVGQERATIGFTVTDRAGDGIEDALVGFSTGASTARSLADDLSSGDYSLRIGDGVSGRASASKPLSAEDSDAVGSGDALDILRLAVGLEPSFGAAQDLDFVAGDLNGDGEVEANDALDALRHAVGLETDNAPRWVFLDSDNLPSGLDNENVEYDAAGVDIAPVSDGLDVSFTGVLLGNMQDFAT